MKVLTHLLLIWTIILSPTPEKFTFIWWFGCFALIICLIDTTIDLIKKYKEK